MDSDTITRDDIVDTQIFDLSDLTDLNKVYHKTFRFRQVPSQTGVLSFLFAGVVCCYLSASQLGPFVRFSKFPKTFRARKAIFMCRLGFLPTEIQFSFVLKAKQ